MPIELDVSRTVSDSGLSSVGTAPVSSGGGGGGTAGIEVVQLDASGGNVTETLPTPSEGGQVLYVRVDDTANTATIEDPNGDDIFIFGLPNQSFYEVPPRGTVFLVSDDVSWYIENFNGGSGSISGFAPGQPSPRFPLMRQKVTQKVLLREVFYDAKSSPSGTVSLSAQQEGSPAFSSVSMSSGAVSDNSFEVILKEGDVLLVTIDQFDEALRDLSMTFA